MKIGNASFTFEDFDLSCERARSVATRVLHQISCGIDSSVTGEIATARIDVRMPRNASASDLAIARRITATVVKQLARRNSKD